MRNLKRVLSLSLASIMLLGMMVIGSSAASDYTDVDYSEDNVEAIEVLNAIGVMNGDLDSNGELAGTFRPGDEVKRSEMARIMAFLMDLDYDYYIGANPFDDMVGHWAEKYAAACYANGIISGRTTTPPLIYDPDATVTAVEAASMLMRALGYFQNKAVDYPDGFEISTIRQAGKINLFDRVDAKTNEPMTRNDVAQLILNTLQSGMVEPDSSSRVEVTVGDAQVSLGSTNYVYVVARDTAVGDAINTTKADKGNSNTGLEGSILDLGEKLYNGKLRLINYDTDVYQRPARTWEYDGKEIGTYVKTELLKQEWPTKVTGEMLYNLLSKSTIDNYKFVISIDGETEEEILNPTPDTAGSHYGWFTQGNLVRTNTEAVGKTGKGVLTQVYVDPDEGEKGTVYISIINTYLAKATGDYIESKDEVTFAVWDLVENTKGHLLKRRANSYNEVLNTYLTVSGEDFDITGVEEDDIVLVRVAEGEIQEIIAPQVVESTEISSFKVGDWVNAEGTQYDYASTALYDTEVLDEYDNNNMKDTLYRIYLDQNDYLIGIEILEATNNYVFLAGLDTSAYNLGNKRAEANVIFTDGTSATVTVNLEKSKAYKDSIKWMPGTISYTTATDPDSGSHFTGTNTAFVPFTQGALWNTWCTYSVDSSGVYTLTEVASNVTGFLTNDSGARWDGTKRSTDRVGQGEGTVNGNIVIDTKRIGLNGIAMPGFGTVYGNDESVYITASLAKINTAQGLRPGSGSNDKEAIIINGVDSVVTGVSNASLDVWTLAQIAGKTDYQIGTAGADNKPGSAYSDPIAGTKTFDTDDDGNTSNGVYTLFNDKGYVIAAVVVGEDNGSTSSYAYIYGNDPVIYEGYDKETEKWTWRANAIVNGELVVLEEVAENRSELTSSVTRNNWYEVKYKADGTVRKMTLISASDVAGGGANAHAHDDKIFCIDAAVDPTADTLVLKGSHVNDSIWPKYVGKIEFVEDSSVANDGKLLLFEDLTGNVNYTIKALSNSLQVTNATGVSKGFYVDPSARVWLIQDEWANVDNRTGVMASRLDCGNGESGLKRAISSLNLYDPRNAVGTVFKGYISAVFENGRATTVIIYERNENLIDQGTTVTGSTITIQDNNISVKEVNDYLDEYGTVIIDDDWTPIPVAGETRRVDIPAGHTLQINGSFDTVNGGNPVRVDAPRVSTSTAKAAKLIVTGIYTMSEETSRTVDYDIQAGTMQILRNRGSIERYDANTVQQYGVTVRSKVTVTTGGLLIQDATDEDPLVHELTIADGATMTVTGGVTTRAYDSRVTTAGTNTVHIGIDGTFNANGAAFDMDGNYWVNSNESLHALGGTIGGKLVLNGGTAEITDAEYGIYSESGSDVLIIPEGAVPNIQHIAPGMILQFKNTTNEKIVATYKAAVSAGTSIGSVDLTDEYADEDKEAEIDLSAGEALEDGTFLEATENGVVEGTEVTAVIGGATVYGELADVIDGANEAGGTSTITLNKDVTLTERLTISASVELDLNGHSINSGGSRIDNFLVVVHPGDNKEVKIYSSANGKGEIKQGSGSTEDQGYALYVKSGIVTLENLSLYGNGGLFVSYDSAGATTKPIDLTIDNCTIQAVSPGQTKDGYAGIATYGSDQIESKRPQIKVSNSTIERSGGNKASAIYAPGLADITLTNCTVKGPAGITTKAGSITVSGGSIAATGTHIPGSFATASGKADHDTNAICVESNSNYGGEIKIDLKNTALSVTGTYTGEGDEEGLSGKIPLVREINDGSTAFLNLTATGVSATALESGKIQLVDGSTYKWDPTNWLVETQVATKNTNNTWTVADVVED